MRCWRARRQIFPLLFAIFLLSNAKAYAPPRWVSWAYGCGQVIVSGIRWLGNTNQNVSDTTRNLAGADVPSTGRPWLDWLASVRRYLNPQVSAAISRGLQLYPELESANKKPNLGEPRDANRMDLWDTLLNPKTSLEDFESQLPQANELLSAEERKALAKWLFAEGIRGAMKNPSDPKGDQLKRAVLLVRSDSQFREGMVQRIRRQFPALGSLPPEAED